MSIKAKGTSGKLTGNGVVIRKDGTREDIVISIPVSEEQGKAIERSMTITNNELTTKGK